MKNIISIILLFSSYNLIFSQETNYKILLDSGKVEYKNGNYSKAIEYLKLASIKKPNNPEIKYFLGYAYSGLEAGNWNERITKTRAITSLSSIQFEEIIKISSLYQGEIISLSPKSKLTSLWGALALTYLDQNKNDSAIWAFNEGKTRGGFSDYFLSIYRETLKNCKKNAILFATGDNPINTLYYLQSVEGFRKDVKIIGISYLNNTWYPNFLKRNNLANFGQFNDSLSHLSYRKWNDSIIYLGDFNWTVSPTYNNEYLLRNNRLFLGLIINNNFNNEIYFVNGVSKRESLGLIKFSKCNYISYQFNGFENSNKYKKKNLKKIQNHFSKIDTNCIEELNSFDNIRYAIMTSIEELYQKNKTQKALKIFKLFRDNYGPDKISFQHQEGLSYYNYIESHFLD